MNWPPRAAVVPLLLAGWWLFHGRWGDTFQEAVLTAFAWPPWVLAIFFGVIVAIIGMAFESIVWSGWD